MFVVRFVLRTGLVRGSVGGPLVAMISQVRPCTHWLWRPASRSIPDGKPTRAAKRRRPSLPRKAHSGDIIDFLELRDSLDFLGAKRRLVDIAGVLLNDRDAVTAAVRSPETGRYGDACLRELVASGEASTRSALALSRSA